MSSITFEVAALADAIKKAAKVAPSKGAAFDKASGIVLEFTPGGPPLCVIRATNLDIFSMEWVNVNTMDGEPAAWRLPSALLAMVVGSLPIGTGKTVTLHSETHNHGFIVHLKSGKVRAKFYPIDMSYYPEWGAFDPDKMFPASDLGGRFDQVEWAASKSDPKISGVYLDGQYAIATDTYRLAAVPLAIPDLVDPIVVPSGVLGQVLRQTGDVQIGVDGHLLNIMPDQYSQIKSVVMDVQYPKVGRIMEMEFNTTFPVNRDVLLEVMQRVNTFAQGDRTAAFQIYFGKSEINIFMVNEQAGQIGDTIEVPGHIDHPRFELKFTPKNIMEALSKAPNKDVTISYNVGIARTIVKIDDGAGYRAWVMPRLGTSEPQEED